MPDNDIRDVLLSDCERIQQALIRRCNAARADAGLDPFPE